ncbi:hypothetical protein LIER_15049 [Lithospermum erythrorhizon]|uniref:Uncharacterized protein n=1 Tax=Lithospermum erythrorhizon TaxID=34254 RepID=A0AAV3Q1T0_LITER
MGGCVSLSLSQKNYGDVGVVSSAHVISLNGELLEFPAFSTVSDVLESQQLEPKSESCFLCNSDMLNFDEFISPLDINYQLQAGQIYFMLHESKLHYKLSASDMAALAVKASLALQKTVNNSSRIRKSKKARISPIILDIQKQGEDYSENGYSFQNKNQKSYGLGVSRSGSVKKFQRLSSRKAKLAVKSFKLKLSTIHEGTVLLSH